MAPIVLMLAAVLLLGATLGFLARGLTLTSASHRSVTVSSVRAGGDRWYQDNLAPGQGDRWYQDQAAGSTATATSQGDRWEVEP